MYACGFRIYFTPSRGSFRLSLTVLVHYRSITVFSLGGWSPIFRQDFSCPALLVARSDPPATFSHTGLSPTIGQPFQTVLLSNRFSRAGSSPFARHYLGISVDFFSSGVLRCFSSPVRLHIPMYSGWDTSQKRWVSPFGYRGSKRHCQLPRFSQACTSFIACDRQGIHHMHFVA